MASIFSRWEILTESMEAQKQRFSSLGFRLKKNPTDLLDKLPNAPSKTPSSVPDVIQVGGGEEDDKGKALFYFAEPWCEHISLTPCCSLISCASHYCSTWRSFDEAKDHGNETNRVWISVCQNFVLASKDRWVASEWELMGGKFYDRQINLSSIWVPRCHQYPHRLPTHPHCWLVLM